jgi:RNA polymerase primary sigma factor
VTVEEIKDHDDVRKLLDEGKRKGVLTYDEINDTLSQQDELDADQLEDLLQTFADEGIQVVDKVKDAGLIEEPAIVEEGPARDIDVHDEELAAMEGLPIDGCGRSARLRC